MKSKTKFLWMYTIILFSVALILILVAGLTQQNYEEELASHQNAAVGMQRSVTELSETNMNLAQENEALKKENEVLKEENEELSVSNELNGRLVQAVYYSNMGYDSKAESILADVDKELLGEEQKSIYEKIMK